jgi:hypothetical protein
VNFALEVAESIVNPCVYLFTLVRNALIGTGLAGVPTLAVAGRDELSMYFLRDFVSFRIREWFSIGEENRCFESVVCHSSFADRFRELVVYSRYFGVVVAVFVSKLVTVLSKNRCL